MLFVNSEVEDQPAAHLRFDQHHCCLLSRKNNASTFFITNTVKFLKFQTPEDLAVIFLKFKQRHETLGNFIKKVQME